MLNKTRLLTPGPTPLPESVRLALAKDMIHHRKADFKGLMHGVAEKLRQLFGTSSPVLPLACSGTGAMTAAVYSLFSPGQRVLVVEAGKFGERWRDIAISRQLEVVSLAVEWGQAAPAEAIATILDENPDIAGVLVQLCETSTTVLQPVEQYAAITRQRNVLLVVDGISGVGISPCPMDAWGIDCLLTGSQKGLMLPPGLALIALSPRAWQQAESIPPGCFYFNLPAERASLEKDQTLFTTPVSLIFGLDASLDLLLSRGLSAVHSRQWALTLLVRAGLATMGLKPLAVTNFSWGVTAAILPEGVAAEKVLRVAQEEYGVCLAGGQDKLKGRIVRIGHMGWVDWADCLAGLYALDRGIVAAGGYLAARDYLERAMVAYNAALRVSPGEIPDLPQLAMGE